MDRRAALILERVRTPDSAQGSGVEAPGWLSPPIPSPQPRPQKVSGWLLMVCAALSLVTPLASLPAADAAEVELRDGLRVLRISGTPYELGRQHGEALREEIRASIDRVLGYFRRYLRVPWIRSLAVNWWLDSAWREAEPFVPSDYLEELRGLADGSGVSLRELRRFHAIPDRTYACSNFAAWGRATSGGRLIHVRNLDWSIEAGIQQSAVIFVVRPTGKHAFVSVGWAGLIGVLTGVNDAQLSVGQVGAETLDVTFRCEPMAFLMREVLERAGDVDQASSRVLQASRTIGANYVFADAKARRAVVVETTHRHARVFEADDPAEHRVTYARPMPDVVFRADAAVDPRIRDRQLASHGDPSRPGLEDPSGSSAYEIRYCKQAELLTQDYGHLTPERARIIAQAVAPNSNIQSVVFAWPDVWIANAQDRVPAAQREYHHLNVRVLLEPSQ